MNLYVTACYDLGKNPDVYEAMTAVSSRSICERLEGMDAAVVLRGRAESFTQMERSCVLKLYELWKGGNNILWIDSDVVALAGIPFDWARGRHGFRMFSLVGETTSRYAKALGGPWWNSGVLYIPQDLDISIWGLGLELWQRPEEKHDFVQYVFNRMLFAQIPEWKNLRPDPAMNWHAECPGCSEIKLYHTFSTRGPLEALREMERAYVDSAVTRKA